MADFILRPAAERDREQIIKLWRESFGDSPGLISALLDCGLITTAVGAELDGALRSVIFAFDGLETAGINCSYLYALCTESAYRSRGLGRAVTAYAVRESVRRGAEAVFLRPGDEGLEKWYASMGASVMLRAKAEKYRPDPCAAHKCEGISPLEYLRLRTGCSWTLPPTLLLAQGCIHRFCGGAFLRCDGGIICAEQRESGLLIRECISACPEAALASAAAHFGVSELLLLRPGEGGLPLMRLPVGNISPKIPETALMPFTLD